MLTVPIWSLYTVLLALYSVRLAAGEYFSGNPVRDGEYISGDTPATTSADVCLVRPLVGSTTPKESPYPLPGPKGKTCKEVVEYRKTHFDKEVVLDFSGVFAPYYYTHRPQTESPGSSNCRNISALTIEHQASTGDFVLEFNGCLHEPGHELHQLTVFSKPGCFGRPYSPKLPEAQDTQIQNYEVSRSFPSASMLKRGRYPCYGPGFKIQSFLFTNGVSRQQPITTKQA